MDKYDIGNYFIYDADGKAIGYNRPQITSFNKKEMATTTNHKNVIVLGDGEADVNMIDKSNYENVLTIGFFNMLKEEKHYDERLAHFQNIYDIVLPSDSGLEKVVEILS